MIELLRRLSILLLVLLLVMGAAEHLFLTTTSHAALEANCPVHGGIVQLERTQLLLQVPVYLMREVQDKTSAFDLSAKISHPPTI